MTEVKKAKGFRLQPASRPDLTLPYPFFLDNKGRVGRQDFWKGEPKKLVGFSPIKVAKSVSGEISLGDFLRDPQRAVGMYPIFEHADGNWFTYKEKIKNVEVL